jgi:serine/threonine-protein kinase
VVTPTKLSDTGARAIYVLAGLASSRAGGQTDCVRIGSYDVVGQVGRGGMGVVFRARSADGRDVAIKVLARRDALAAGRFERERRLLSSLGDAEGFVPLVATGEISSGPFLVMPFMPGGTLRTRLSSGPLGVDATLALGRALATALGRAHERGIVHRDLKPENILFAADGRPLIADLGLAKHFSSDAPGASQSVSLSAAGELLGTAGYMAREQMRDAKNVGPPADVFALGAILYECLCGRPSFFGDSTYAVAARVEEGTFEPLGRVARETPRWLVAVVERALAREPTDRYPDALALGRALAADGRGKGARRWVGAAGVVLALGGLGAAWRIAIVRSRLERASALAESAVSALDSGDLDPARRDIDGALELDPRLALAWAQRGRLCLWKDDADGAIAAATRAIELDAKCSPAWLARGRARTRKRELPAAIADLTRAVELAPGSKDPVWERAMARDRAKDAEGTIADATTVLALDPGFVPALTLRSMYLTKKGDEAAAIRDLARAAALEPKNAATRSNLAYLRAHTGDLEGARADLEVVLALEPGDAAAWDTRGYVALLKQDYPESIASYEKAAELEPRNAETWSNLGVARAGVRDLEGAIAAYSKAIALEPKNAAGFANRANAYERLGDRANAIADYERFLELAPQSNLAEQVRTRLAKLKR